MKLFQNGDRCPCCGQLLEGKTPEWLALFSQTIELLNLPPWEASPLSDREDETPSDDGLEPAPGTNFARVHAMNDKQLVDAILSINCDACPPEWFGTEACVVDADNNTCCPNVCWLRWLRTEAQEE